MRIQASIFMVVALLLFGCNDKPSKEYVHDVLLPMTPIKDQGQSQLCWAYAMLATIETEHILRGDSVNLSAVYVGRMLKRNNQRAMGQTALNILQRDGVVGYDVLPDDATKELSTPKWVFMLGARYTPKEFAHSVCAQHNRLLNIPLDTLKAHVDRALQHRHPVCWESRGHAMSIVGLAHDSQKQRYYVMKNSWGTDQPHGGLVYMPVDKMWSDMIALYMTKEAYYNE